MDFAKIGDKGPPQRQFFRPIVTVYSEVSADGKTTHRRNASSKPMMVFEDEYVKEYRHELRAKSDAIMVGSHTILTDNPHLTVRHADGTNPLRVIPSSRGDLPLTSNIFSGDADTLVAVSAAASNEAIESIRGTGASVMTAGTSQVDLAALFQHLHDLKIRSLMVEGGATLLASLFRARLVDRFIVQHLPVIFGGNDVPCMVGGPAMSDIDEAIRLRLVDVSKIGAHAVVTYECA